MESLQSAIQMITPMCYMASIDLKDAYYCIPVAKDHQKYLKFQWNSTLYQYTSCPMGLCMSPRIFTKVLKPIFCTLRRQGHQSVIYIDDTYLQGSSVEACNKNVKDTVELLARMGFVINPEKSLFHASQTIEFLGFILNSIDMTITLSETKAAKIKDTIQLFLEQKPKTIRELCKVIGNLVACFPAVPYGKLFYRQIENEKIMALKSAKGRFESKVELSHAAKADMKWWMENIHMSSSPISRGNPDIIIETDSSTQGWGYYCRALNISAGGPWKTEEAQFHINVLELQAAFFALQAICSDKKNIHVQLLMDSMTAVSYVREQGGSRSLQCNAMARKIWLWSIDRNIWLSSSFIPGKSNIHADFQSRNFQQDNEWMLNRSAFKMAIDKLHVCPKIDLFASRYNHQVPVFVSWRPEPESFAVDAFTLNWHELQFYCFPPFSVMPAVLQKIVLEKATGIVVMPNWPTQPFYATAMKLLIDYPIFLRKSKRLLQLPGKTDIHKIWEKLDLLVCHLSGDQLKIENFRKMLRKYSCHLGDKEPKNNTSVTFDSGKHSVVDGISIPFVQVSTIF